MNNDDELREKLTMYLYQREMAKKEQDFEKTDAIDAAFMHLIVTDRERAVRQIEGKILSQEYPEDVILWTPDGRERTRVIKTEDVKYAIKTALKEGL